MRKHIFQKIRGIQHRLANIFFPVLIPDGCLIDRDAVLHKTCRIANHHGGENAIHISKSSHICGELLTFGHGGKIQIGSYCYVGENTRIWSALSITVGNRVLISHGVNIFDNDTHPIDDSAARHTQFKHLVTTGFQKTAHLNEQAVSIHDDVLIGCNVIILPGVSIGEGAVVGAGSVVTKDVPPWTLVAGNPARIIRPLNRPEPASD